MSAKFSNKKNPKRHRLVPKRDKTEKPMLKSSGAAPRGMVGAKAKVPDVTLADLLDHLQTALELELSTIPPYLSALYSIKDGSNQMAVEIIKSVVIEEMLHMVMVANLINSLGGTPIIGQKINGVFTPTYPTPLPGNVMPELKVGLKYFSKETIRTFERIEHPEGGISEEVHKHIHSSGQTYAGIGAFYLAIEKDLFALEAEAQASGGTIFTGTTPQVTGEHYYGAGGKIINVSNLDDALEMIEEIVGQGEGTLGSIFAEPYDPDNDQLQLFGPDFEEYAHYFRFKEIRHERFYAPTDSAHRDGPNKGLPTGEPLPIDWDAVHKFAPDPKLSEYPEGSIQYNKTLEFNQTYMALLDNLNEACNGNPDALNRGIPIMYDLKYKAIELMNIPRGNGRYVAGPSFEYADRTPPV